MNPSLSYPSIAIKNTVNREFYCWVSIRFSRQNNTNQTDLILVYPLTTVQQTSFNLTNNSK